MACGGGVPVGRPAHAHGWCSRVVLTGWQAARHARARKRSAARAVANGTTVVPSGSCSGKLCLCITDCACVGEGCAACSESQWKRAPTLSVASVVECPRLATGLAVSIEASPELPGAFSKKRSVPKMLASARGTKGGMKVFWTEGSGRVREKAKRIGRMLAVYCPPMVDSCNKTVVPIPLDPRFLVAARSASRTLSLFFASRRHPCEPPVQCTCVRCVGLSFLSVGGI